ncbi:angiopoietin-2-like [Watersipora subatra]|uniref:angiopoietin-2-like n=1 Tax=Watersipora subatra TaxID=2589382 RepID=UPI00355C5C32
MGSMRGNQLMDITNERKPLRGDYPKSSIPAKSKTGKEEKKGKGSKETKGNLGKANKKNPPNSSRKNCPCTVLPKTKAAVILEIQMNKSNESSKLLLLKLETTNTSGVVQSPYNITEMKKYLTKQNERISSDQEVQQILQAQLKSLETNLSSVLSQHKGYDMAALNTKRDIEELYSLISANGASIINADDDVTYMKEELSKLANNYKDLKAYVSHELANYMYDKISSKILDATRKSVRPISYSFRQFPPKDCDELAAKGHIVSGVYEIWPPRIKNKVQVYCRMSEGRGWIVLQRRKDGITSFAKPLKDYEFGFGSLYGDFWLGNTLINALTSNGEYQLKIELIDWDNREKITLYNHFQVESKENDYRLVIGKLVGFPNEKDPILAHNGLGFSAPETVGYSNRCADISMSGWWFPRTLPCGQANLNGIYSTSSRSKRDWYGKRIFWVDEGNRSFDVKYASMEISKRIAF